jgi:hypothetical protein
VAAKEWLKRSVDANLSPVFRTNAGSRSSYIFVTRSIFGGIGVCWRLLFQ